MWLYVVYTNIEKPLSFHAPPHNNRWFTERWAVWVVVCLTETSPDKPRGIGPMLFECWPSRVNIQTALVHSLVFSVLLLPIWVWHCPAVLYPSLPGPLSSNKVNPCAFSSPASAIHLADLHRLIIPGSGSIVWPVLGWCPRRWTRHQLT